MGLELFDEDEASRLAWDIDRPQRELIRLTEDHQIKGRVLELGCCSGENMLYLASKGLEVWGIDASPAAIARGKRKVEHRGIKATFCLGDPARIRELGQTFDVVLDFGFFHTIWDDDKRFTFANALPSILSIGGIYYLLCFNEYEPAEWGASCRITQKDIQRIFGEGWKIKRIRRATFDTSVHKDGGQAWLATILREWEPQKAGTL